MVTVRCLGDFRLTVASSGGTQKRSDEAGFCRRPYYVGDTASDNETEYSMRTH